MCLFFNKIVIIFMAEYNTVQYNLEDTEQSSYLQ